MASRLSAKRKFEELEKVFAALAHSARRQVLLVVWFRGGRVSAGDIAARFHHSWPTTTRHLQVLQRAGLLLAEREGRSRYYRVDREKLRLAIEWLNWFEPETALREKGGKRYGINPRGLRSQ